MMVVLCCASGFRHGREGTWRDECDGSGPRMLSIVFVVSNKSVEDGGIASVRRKEHEIAAGRFDGGNQILSTDDSLGIFEGKRG